MELQSQELGELDQGSSVNSITNETPFAAEMKSEPPLDVPVVFHTDLLPLPFPSGRRSPSPGLCIALLSVSGGWLMKCFGAQDQVS